jgi:hypothetical protein
MYVAAAAAALAGFALVSPAGPVLEFAAGRVRLARPVRFARAFLQMNLAMLEGWRKFVSGRAEITWQPDRSVHRQSV